MSEENETTNPLEDLVGPGKKFATVEDLARGKLEADKFIDQLKTEKTEVLTALERAEKEKGEQATIADLIKTFRQGGDSDSKEGNQALSDDELQEKIRSIIKGDETKRTREANREQGNKLVLQKANGDAELAKALVAERAAKLGMSPDKLVELSEMSPTAFAKVMEIDLNPNSSGTAGLPKNHPENSSDQGKMEVDGKKTKAYYDSLKAKLGPAKYYSDTKIQLSYMRDATALGDRFNT